MPTPTTWLPPIPGLHRRDPEHRYWLGEAEFPVSVTGVLGVLKSDYAMDRIEATREVWAPRGNSCHRALELFLLLEHSDQPGFRSESDEMVGLLHGDYSDWIAPLLTHDRWGQVQVIASEMVVACTQRRVAGCFDLAFIDEAGRTILADLKSLGSAESSTYCTRAQLGGYAALLKASHGVVVDACQTIWARPGSTTFSPLYSVAECRTAWAGAWATFKARASEPGFIS
jgi:hypothetical protein